MASVSESAMADGNILLSIVEQADLKTIVALMCTQRAYHELIRSYEHSICIKKYRQLGFMPIDGDLLSTTDENRYTVHRHTFRAVAELTTRETRIDTLLNSNFLLPLDPTQVGLTPEQATRFRDGLKHVMHITDHIADLAVTVTHNDNTPIPPTTNTPLPFPSILTLPSAFPDTSLLPSTLPPYAALPLSLTPTPDLIAGVLSIPSFRRLRSAQIAYLTSLPTTTLALLKTLSELAGSAYARAIGPKLLSDPDCADRTLAYQECVLRRGTIALWGLREGDSDRTIAAATREVLEEVRLWQGGGGQDWMQAGLQMTVMGTLRGRLVYGGRDEFDEFEWEGEGVERHVRLGREIERVVDEFVGRVVPEDESRRGEADEVGEGDVQDEQGDGEESRAAEGQAAGDDD